MEWIEQALGLSLEDLEWNHMLLRAVVVFLVALLLIRVTGMRTFGTKSAFDIVLSITIGGVLSRAITGHYPFFATLLSAAMLAFCHKLIAFISLNKAFNQLMEGQAICIYEQGRLHTSQLKKFAINDGDLIRALREQGLKNYDRMETMWYEADGKISIVKFD